MLLEISQAIEGNAKAIRSLTQKGQGDLNTIAQIIEREENKLHYGLASVLRNVRNPENLSTLIRMVDSPSWLVRISALTALVSFEQPQAYEVIAAKILRFKDDLPFLGPLFLEIGSQRSVQFSGDIKNFINNIGETYHSNSFDETVSLLISTGDYGSITTLLDAAKALGQLGATEIAESVELFIIKNSAHANPFLKSAVARAVTCLDFLPTSSTVKVLTSLANSTYWETRQNAVRGLYIFGDVNAVQSLILYLEDEDFQTRSNAHVFINKISGLWPDDQSELDDLNPARVSSWWHERKSEFQTNTLLRNGLPIQYKNLVVSLKNKYLRKEAYDELSVYLAPKIGYEDFCPIDQQWMLYENADIWLKNNASRYIDGVPYRMGFVIT